MSLEYPHERFCSVMAFMDRGRVSVDISVSPWEISVGWMVSAGRSFAVVDCITGSRLREIMSHLLGGGCFYERLVVKQQRVYFFGYETYFSEIVKFGEILGRGNINVKIKTGGWNFVYPRGAYVPSPDVIDDPLILLSILSSPSSCGRFL